MAFAYSSICSICGHRIFTSKQSAWYHWSHIGHSTFSIHASCWKNNPDRVHQLLEEADRDPHPQ